uniref:Uncharacterized protein n=1 Tax=Siphoviridae sp. ctgyq20 TaxID=2825611 RepID=A0A8S5PDZ9_9CAUD|nr:MAG TPA: hypothetical protein [Siphoviridae sp. ctgyq20]
MRTWSAERLSESICGRMSRFSEKAKRCCVPPAGRRCQNKDFWAMDRSMPCGSSCSAEYKIKFETLRKKSAVSFLL